MLITGYFYHRGFTLIELLVALLVLCIGVLGLATLQAQLLKQNLDIASQSRVSNLIFELAERMRANPELASLYPADLQTGICSSAATPCGVSIDGSGPACTGADLAAYDRWDILCRFSEQRGIPQRINRLDIQQLTVQCNAGACAGSSEYTLAINWRRPTIDHAAPPAGASVVRLAIIPGAG